MRNDFLPLSSPWIEEEDIAEVVDTLRSEWITTGPKVKRFERDFAAAVNAPAALAVNSCTAALHVALSTLGIGHGDAVITTPVTFCCSVHVIEQVGARPILVDVEPDTLNIDAAKVRQACERLERNRDGLRLKAIMPVHLYGHPCAMDELMGIATEYGAAIIDDAAHALPASYNGQMIGSFAERAPVPILTCFSFYATKNLSTGEGGMLVGAPGLIEEARIRSLHGMSRDAWKRYSSDGSWYYEVVRSGFKYNMTDIQASLGIHQLRRLPELQARRKRVVETYNRAFSSRPEFQIPAQRPEVDHAWHLYVLRLNASHTLMSRNELIHELRTRNIGSSVHFIPIHLHPYFRDRYGYRPDDFPIALREYFRLVSLPLSPKMTDRDTADVIEAVMEIVGRSAASASAA
jgi:dTDP-4-amino-4,6-dideoxygalactose transaminase